VQKGEGQHDGDSNETGAYGPERCVTVLLLGLRHQYEGRSLRKLKRPRAVSLPPVRISVNDIEELVKLIKSVTPEAEPQISTEDYEFDTLGEFRDWTPGKPPKQLHLKMTPIGSSVPIISVDVYPSSVTLRANEDDELSSAVLTKASEFLRSKQRRSSLYGERVRTVIILMLMAGLLLIILTSTPVTTNPPPSGPPLLSSDVKPIGGMLAGLGFAGMLWISQIHSRIITRPSTQTRRPLNWDFIIQLASLAIAVLSFVVGLLALWKT
jgi:hypothetical protein